MRRTRKVLTTGRAGAGFLALLFLGQGARAQEGAAKSVEVFFSPKGGGHEAVARAIAKATKTVDIAMYSVSPGQVAMWTPLADAVKRGVKCRFVLHAGNSAAAKSKSAAVENIGCDARFVSGTMHQKFAVIDGQTITTGSANWSTGAEQKYSENITVFNNFVGVAKDFQAEFERLWARTVDFPLPAGARPRYPRVDPGSGVAPAAADGIVTLFTSQNSKTTMLLNDALIALIKNAKTTLDIATAHFDTDQIKDETCAAVARGVKVRVVTDMGEYNIGASKVKALEACNTPVRYKVYGLAYWHPYSQLMHHKYAIADGKTLATGSYNWSTTAEKGNAENLQVIDGAVADNTALVAAFQREFDWLWDLNRDRVQKMIETFNNPPAGKCVPIHWDTTYFKMVISLTRAEYLEVRRKGVAAGLYNQANAKSRCVDYTRRKFYGAVFAGQWAPELSL
ncbi:MAG: phosphatidylserine/phosphatidylglycerophosphate/cardiolipin synthase family protein [Deltaproteobacteria bacterium]|nr:phosphatidylserine/phosphatidylglycerophosphate/cardiolipin synthase family protein [Deltaproteobacteria bacterium]